MTTDPAPSGEEPTTCSEGIDLEEAVSRLEGVANKTPVLSSPRLDALAGATVFLKAENLQVTGSFKFRGAYNAVRSLSNAKLNQGIVAFSSGNHAQAVAIASTLCGTNAVVLMPEDAPISKIERTVAYGARVVTYDRQTENRVEMAAKIASTENRTMIPSFDHRHVIAGAGTAAVELLGQVAELDTMLVCVGGGGLLAGSALAARTHAPDLELFGVEPEAGNDHVLSRYANEPVTIEPPITIADGQRVTRPGTLTWPISNEAATDFLEVTDKAITEAMRFLFNELKIVVEPSGASALAALLADRTGRFVGRRIGITLSGGNVDLARFFRLADRYTPES